jgi:hypothetical protein
MKINKKTSHFPVVTLFETWNLLQNINALVVKRYQVLLFACASHPDKIFCGSHLSCQDNNFANDHEPPPEELYLTYHHSVSLAKLGWTAAYSVVLLCCCNKEYNSFILMNHRCYMHVN